MQELREQKMKTTVAKTKKRPVYHDVIVESIPVAQGMPDREKPFWHTFPLGSKWARRIALLIIALVPFHAFLTVWLSTFGVNYTLIRLWSLLPLALLGSLGLYWMIRDTPSRHKLLAAYIPRVIVLFTVVLVLLTLRGILLHRVSPAAASAGLFLDLRYLLFFLVVYVIANYQRDFEKSWVAVAVGAGIIVAAFAVLQYLLLPHNFLTHFGYGPHTIAPVETINNDPRYIRVISFLRGANPLGAYMVVIISLLLVFRRWWRHRLVWLLALVLALAALLFSFSRSAWIATAVAVAVIFFTDRLTLGFPKYRVTLILLGLAVLAGGIFSLGAHNTALQNALYHTSNHSKVAISSNQRRASAMETAIVDVIHSPLGNGAGSAGPASTHNTEGPVKIAENYYLQIGQEGGWVALIIYGVLTIAMAVTLWWQRDDPLAKALLASFTGLIVVNVLSHAWTDDTLSYVWWGLAGAVLGHRAWWSSRKNNSVDTASHD